MLTDTVVPLGQHRQRGPSHPHRDKKNSPFVHMTRRSATNLLVESWQAFDGMGFSDYTRDRLTIDVIE